MPAQTLLLVDENQGLFLGAQRGLSNALQESGQFILVQTIVAIPIHRHQIQKQTLLSLWETLQSLDELTEFNEVKESLGNGG